MINNMARLDNLWQRGLEFLGSQTAILGGAMSWVSERFLVSAISNAGGFGVIACGSMPPKLLEAEIVATKSLTDKPFGVNLVTMHPDIDELLDVCLRQNISHIILAGGLPTQNMIKMAKTKAKVMCFAPTLAVAKRLVKLGCDAIIIEGMEAGGHIGPVSTSVLAQEIVPEITEVPVFVAGGIGRGSAIAMYLKMGAAGVQLGTRFVCASESIAHANFKQAFIRASARDALPSIQIDPRFPVIPVRALQNASTQSFAAAQVQAIRQVETGELTKEAAQLMIEKYWAGALRRAVIDGDIDQGSVMAGQSVGMVKKEQPVAEIIKELIAEAVTSLDKNDR